MQITTRMTRWLLTIAASLTLLAGCGGGSDSDDSNGSNSGSDDTLSGTAATGAAMDGFVYVVDATGTEVNVAIEDDGSYSIVVSGMTAPFMVRAVPSSGDTQYSWAEAANVVANITPMTTLALFLANDYGNLATLASSWSTAASSLSADDIEEAQAQINANFADAFDDNGLDESTYDFFTAAFSANSTGYDAVLDDIAISFNMSEGNFSVVIDGENFSYDTDIDTSGISFGGGSIDVGDGSWTLTFSGTFTSGVTTTTIPSTTVTGLDAPESISEVEDRVEDQYLSTASTTIKDFDFTVTNDTETRKTYTISFTIVVTVDIDGTPFPVESDYSMTYDYQKD